MVIVVDTRERQPWEWPGSIRARLHYGDYSVQGFETLVSVERKSLEDFVQTLTRARARFFREVQALARYRFARVVVEASIQDVLAGRYSSGVSPASIIGSAMSIDVDFGVPVVFAGDRQHARLWTEKFLDRCVQRLERRKQAEPVQPTETAEALAS